MFGGNSNWRGPLWFPLNYLMVSVLERYHRFYGDDHDRIPHRVGNQLNLGEIGHANLADRARTPVATRPERAAGLLRQDQKSCRPTRRGVA